ncbi:MAG: TIGR01458 family HAD-type hydrolase, partial [Myxococcota bacterium]|nr:TIGR01458 family HAD-type hydrolase [Myxococcota bacterium]
MATQPPRAVLLDMDGVLYRGDDAIPGAAETVAWLRDEGVPHLFLTNTTSRPRAALVEKLGGMGIEVEEDAILTPPVAARGWLAEHAPGPAALFVPDATAGEFADLERLPDDAEEGAASVVLGDLGPGWSFARLNRAFRLLMADPQPALVALGMTRYWRAPDGLRLDVAPFVVALQHASGAEPVVLGKPAPPFFERALGMVGTEAAATVCVGDDVVGDVGGAQKAGIRGIQVRTGMFRPADLEGAVSPDAVLDSVADLPGWWREQGRG